MVDSTDANHSTRHAYNDAYLTTYIHPAFTVRHSVLVIYHIQRPASWVSLHACTWTSWFCSADQLVCSVATQIHFAVRLCARSTPRSSSAIRFGVYL